MKQIIIFLLLIIVGIMGFNFYKKIKRFSHTEYEYKIPENVDVNKAEKGLLIDYYEAIEATNGYIITQWSANGIDVRNPNDDDAKTNAAVSVYIKKLANIAFYETQILGSITEKKNAIPTEAEVKKELVKNMFYSNPVSNQLRLGERNALVYEIQKLLISKGDSIRLDGLFQMETFNSLRNFEEKNALFPDGKLDAITLEYLLK